MATQGATPEEVAADCPFINEYCRQQHNSVVKCYVTPEKGRILCAEKAFKQGEVIFREPPLHIVAEQKNNYAFKALKELCAKSPVVFEYDPLWYWTALCSLTSSQLPSKEQHLRPMAITEDQQRKLKLLYHPEITKPSEAAKILAKHLQLSPPLDPVHLEELLQIWILNCFEHSDDPLGYSTYFMSSFMSHHCMPNAVWHYDEDDFVLRARSAIEEHDEICVSYLSEDALLESTASRRKHLKDSKHFLCCCDRCLAIPDSSRGFNCPQCGMSGFFRADTTACGPEEVAGAVCESCRHVVTRDEATLLVEEEKWIETKLDAFEKRIEKNRRGRLDNLMEQVEAVVVRAERSMSQHWLLDKAWGIAADCYDRNDRPAEAEALTRKRIVFQEQAYPGLSGTRAWTLEAYADMILKHNGASVEPRVHLPDPASAQSLAKLAVPVYSESLKILGLMFGEKHEYYTSVSRKAVELQSELQRLLR